MIQALVDHSALLGPVRDQGPRPTCMAFAASAAHGRRLSAATVLSPEYAFLHAAHRQLPQDHYSGVFPDAMYAAIEYDGQPEEHHFPYQSTAISTDSLSEKPVLDDSISIYRRKAIAIAVNDVFKCIAAGETPVLILEITRGFQFINSTANVVVHHPVDRAVGTHAMVAVGIGRDSTHQSFIKIRNSWGGGWGDAGHGWLSEHYLKRRFQSAAYYG